MAVIPIIDPGLCDGCNTCVEECHVHAVDLVEGKAVVARPADCNYCTECETLCPQAAISCPLEIVLWRPES